jgi:polar amino acid transport system substrate-binding protein
LFAGTLNAEPVQLATGNDYRPFTDESLPEGGLITAIVRAIYADQGEAVEVTFLPWNRAYYETKAGGFAATFPFVRNEERAADYYFSRPVYTTTQRPAVLASSDIEGDTLDELAGRSYCLPTGYAPAPAIERMTASGKLTRRHPMTLTGCMRMLDDGAADFIPTSHMLARQTAARALGDADRIRFLDIVVEESTLHVMFPKSRAGAEAARDRFDATLTKFQRGGRLEGIVTGFLGAAGES